MPSILLAVLCLGIFQYNDVVEHAIGMMSTIIALIIVRLVTVSVDAERE